jgi:thiol-disulfide isomerase/thioredoxin
MKRIFLLIGGLLLSFVINSQTVIENPEYGSSTAPYVKITGIELTDSTTVLHFHVDNTPGWWISIPADTYIKPSHSNEKLLLMRTVGIPIGEHYYSPESGEINYTLVFPGIDKAIERIDFGESLWHIDGILLKPAITKSMIPEEFSGDWYGIESGSWELSLLDTVAVYKEKVWGYETVNLKRGKGSVILKNGTSAIEMYIKSNKNGVILIGESPKALTEFSKNIPSQSAFKAGGDEPYKALGLSRDSAVYSGFFAGYNPRTGGSSFAIYFNDFISGEKVPFPIKISDDGSFATRVPVYFPRTAHIVSRDFTGTVFLEPGKEVFQMIRPTGYSSNSLFMGESAGINNDLVLLKNANSFDYNKMRQQINGMTPSMYKTYCQNSLKKDLAALGSLRQAKTICAKAYQVKKMDMEYIYASHILDYDWYFKSAYREQHNITNTQQELPVKPGVLTADYFDFLNEDLLNNPLGLLSDNYNAFMHSFKNIALIQPDNTVNLSLPDLVAGLDKAGFPLTEEERALANVLKEKETQELLEAEIAFSRKIGPQQSKFLTSHRQEVLDFNKIYKGEADFYSMFEKFLNDKGMTLTDDEKALLEVLKEYVNSETYLKNREFAKKWGNAMNNFSNDHQMIARTIFSNPLITDRKENLENKLGIKPGLATDVMKAQEFSTVVKSQSAPFSDFVIQYIQKQLSTTLVAEYLGLKNDALKNYIETMRNKPGYSVANEVPKAEASLLFDAIMKKYRGKVVFVDFWATWCAPCLAGIEQMKPLKEEMAGKDVVFVYITYPGSPKSTWDNMIPGIKGEHYRVSEEEWESLTSMFNITGIPHYVLVDKMGAVVNSHLSQRSNELLMVEIEKYMKE